MKIIRPFICLAYSVLVAFGIAIPNMLWAQAAASSTVNAGFVSGIWYSKSPFFVGDTVRIYSAIQNNSPFDLIGTMKFYDGDRLIGETDFSVVKGQLIQRWADWVVTAGEHTIFAQITDAKKSEIGRNPERIALNFASSAHDDKFADSDTDGDAVGDTTDTDDDNDGLPDLQEVTLRTDTKRADTDGDGRSDNQELTDQTNPVVRDTPRAKAEPLPTAQHEPNLSPKEAFTPEKIVDSIRELLQELEQKKNSLLAPGTDAPPGTQQPVLPNDSQQTGLNGVGLRQTVVHSLQQSKDRVDQELAGDNNREPIGFLKKPLAALEEKIPYFRVPEAYIPTGKRLTSWLLGFALLILNTWWLMLAIFAAVFWNLWKLWRKIRTSDE